MRRCRGGLLREAPPATDTEHAARIRAVAVSEWKSLDKNWAAAEEALARVLAGDLDDQIGWSYGTLEPRRPEQGLNLIPVVVIVTFARVTAYRAEGERELLAEWRFAPDTFVTIEGDHRLASTCPTIRCRASSPLTPGQTRCSPSRSQRRRATSATPKRCGTYGRNGPSIEPPPRGATPGYSAHGDQAPGRERARPTARAGRPNEASQADWALALPRG
jgi:hypothetical protein